VIAADHPTVSGERVRTVAPPSTRTVATPATATTRAAQQHATHARLCANKRASRSPKAAPPTQARQSRAHAPPAADHAPLATPAEEALVERLRHAYSEMWEAS
jgi:hypothetical protein